MKNRRKYLQDVYDQEGSHFLSEKTIDAISIIVIILSAIYLVVHLLWWTI
jgi:hypothetical protein